MNYENFVFILKTHVGGDDKLWINLAWPNDGHCKSAYVDEALSQMFLLQGFF